MLSYCRPLSDLVLPLFKLTVSTQRYGPFRLWEKHCEDQIDRKLKYISDSTLQFINNVLGSKVADCDHGYEACTSEITGYVVPDGSALHTHLGIGRTQRRLIIVDTPGLDNDKFPELKVLDSITSCLHDASVVSIME